MPLRIRRGTDAERQTITPIEGELIYTTDGKRVYVGDGNTVGGVSLTSTAGGPISSNLGLNGFDITGVGNISIVGDISNGSLSLLGDTLTSNSNPGNISVVGFISNGTLTLDGNIITSSDGYIAGGSGNNVGILELGTDTDLLQLKRMWNESTEPYEINYGISNGSNSLISANYSSRGTIASPTTINSADPIKLTKAFGYDGYDYVLSSTVWQGVDPWEAVTPGIVPGTIALVTDGLDGLHVLSFSSRGYLGIGTYPGAPSAPLDVVGDANISGTITAGAFKGSFFGDDSTILIDGINSKISNGIITLTNDSILSTSGILRIGELGANIRTVRNWSDPLFPFETNYGLTIGYSGLENANFLSRGTIESPTAVQNNDLLLKHYCLAHDGTDYVPATGIFHSVDPTAPISPGSVPGQIFLYTGNGYGIVVDYRGYLGIRKDPAEALDVDGNAIIRGNAVVDGEITAASFKGTLVGDDSTILVDGVNKTLSNNVLTLSSDTIFSSTNVLRIGNSDNDIRTIKTWSNPNLSFESNYGLTIGYSGLKSANFVSRGTVPSPVVVQNNDLLYDQTCLAYDGSGYVPVTGIFHSVDPTAPISPGSVPGQIFLFTGSGYGVVIDHRGWIGVRKDPTEALDVGGNAVVRGDGGNTVSALQLEGYNNHGGTGYHDFMSVTNTYSGATNPNKYFRVNTTG